MIYFNEINQRIFQTGFHGLKADVVCEWFIRSAFPVPVSGQSAHSAGQAGWQLTILTHSQITPGSFHNDNILDEFQIIL